MYLRQLGTSPFAPNGKQQSSWNIQSIHDIFLSHNWGGRFHGTIFFSLAFDALLKSEQTLNEQQHSSCCNKTPSSPHSCMTVQCSSPPSIHGCTMGSTRYVTSVIIGHVMWTHHDPPSQRPLKSASNLSPTKNKKSSLACFCNGCYSHGIKHHDS